MRTHVFTVARREFPKVAFLVYPRLHENTNFSDRQRISWELSLLYFPLARKWFSFTFERVTTLVLYTDDCDVCMWKEETWYEPKFDLKFFFSLFFFFIKKKISLSSWILVSENSLGNEREDGIIKNAAALGIINFRAYPFLFYCNRQGLLVHCSY